MTDDQIKHMRDRFLTWELPKTLNPDGGITFKRSESAITYNHPWPIGTNFLNADEAEAMVRHMIEGLPCNPALEEGEITDLRRQLAEAQQAAIEIAKDRAEIKAQLGEAQQARERAEKSLSEVDDVLVVNWVGPRKDGDYRRALHNLVTNAIREYNDPRISEVAAKTIQDLTAANALLRRAQEEMRLIREKDCGVIYDVGLRTAITAHLKP